MRAALFKHVERDDEGAVVRSHLFVALRVRGADLTGFALNFVTATIGAISIGVGIDYSIHMTERYREELGRATDKMAALRQAARGTGVALVASAASSIVGFAIMGFAPMPLFASYGMLTAIMIFLALAASILVLPSLLILVTRQPAIERAPTVPTGDG